MDIIIETKVSSNYKESKFYGVNIIEMLINVN